MKAFQAKLGRGGGSDVLLTEENAEKILDVCLKLFTDMLTFWIIATDDIRFTCRGLLKKIATIFDPLVFAAPLTIKAKLKLKLLDTRGIDWEEKILSMEEDWWKKWFENVPRLRHPRNTPLPVEYPAEDNIKEIELHTFYDTSEGEPTRALLSLQSWPAEALNAEKKLYLPDTCTDTCPWKFYGLCSPK